jgi:hypothetical protein
MRDVLTKHGLTAEALTSMYTMFTTYQVRETLLQRKNANE